MRSKIAGALVLALLCAGVAAAAEKRIVRPAGTKPGGNYSPGPTRTTVVVAKLVGPGRIEITATARK
jgi:hypothetical protein